MDVLCPAAGALIFVATLKSWVSMDVTAGRWP
jgi:hypothetical protein